MNPRGLLILLITLGGLFAIFRGGHFQWKVVPSSKLLSFICWLGWATAIVVGMDVLLGDYQFKIPSVSKKNIEEKIVTSSKPVELDLSKIPLYQPRHFVPDSIDLKKTTEVCALYQKLADMPIESWTDMEKFLADWSELNCVVSEYGSMLDIRMTCQTDDPARSQAYRYFTQEVLPAIKPLEDQLKVKFVSFYDSITPPNDRYAVFVRNIRTDIELFRQENVPLQKQVDALAQDYQTILGAMMVDFQGQQLTIQQIHKKIAEPDRTLREAAWRTAAQRGKQDADRIDDIFDQMVTLRHQIALNAGESNYRDYQFKKMHRFDYTPDDCYRYYEAVEEIVLPALNRIFQHRRTVMNLDTIRPWDLFRGRFVDPYGRPPLHPFTQVQELVSKTRNIFHQLHPDFERILTEMDTLGLLDLESRKGKAPGGYQSTLAEHRQQFIFGNAVGSNSDIYLLLHESGHAFHMTACRNEPLEAYRDAPAEFCETAAITIEWLGSRYLKEFYSEEDARRAWNEKLESVVVGLAWIANIDAFQHWIYEHPQASRQKRHEAWVKNNQRFFGQLYDWTGLSEYHKTSWHRQTHLFLYPFYYIEYGIAELGAIGIWLQAQKNTDTAINNYRKALALGGSRTLPELFAAAGLELDFSARTIGPLVEAVMKEWEKSLGK